jgi:hypothetical protein
MAKKPEEKTAHYESGDSWNGSREESLPPSLPTVAEVQRARNEETMQKFLAAAEMQLTKLDFELDLAKRTFDANLRRGQDALIAARQIVAALRMMIPAAILLFAFSARADWHAPTGPEVAALVVAEATIAFDAFETASCMQRPRECYEQNALLGAHPSTGTVVALSGLAMLATAGAWYALPPPWRGRFAVTVAIVEGANDVKNAIVMGGKFSF